MKVGEFLDKVIFVSREPLGDISVHLELYGCEKPLEAEVEKILINRLNLMIVGTNQKSVAQQSV